MDCPFTESIHGLDVIAQDSFVINLLGLILIGKNKREIFTKKRSFSDTSIFMVTAWVEEIVRLAGQEFCAADHLCKPFSQQPGAIK